MEKLKLKIRNIDELKNYKPLNLKEYDIDRDIVGHTLARKGLELSGFIDSISHYSKYLVGWGTNEYNYLSKLANKEVNKRIEKVIDKNTPGVMLSKGFKQSDVLKVLMKIAEKNRVPVYKFDMHMASIISLLNNSIARDVTRYETIHASFVVINDVGVLIKGKSGIGKSEAVLGIIQRNYTFVGDDSIEIYLNGNFLYGRASKITKDLLEVRGIGLINIPFIYGKRSAVNNARVDLIVELVEEKKDIQFDRLGNSSLKEKIFGKDVPKTLIPIKIGRSISSLIIAAASVFAAKKEGMDPLKTIKSRRH